MNLVVTGGGTGGHIYPAMAIARYFKRVPGTRIVFIGSTRGPEGEAAQGAGLQFVGLELSGVAGKNPIAATKAMARFSRATLECRKMFKAQRPDCVIGTGGYASAPACFAAAWTGIPFILHDLNFRPGLVTRVLSRKAAAVSIAFEGTIPLLKKGARAVVTGVPVREEIEELAVDDSRDRARVKALEFFGLKTRRKTMLVFGGSQGAQAINNAAWSALEKRENDPGMQVLHITGKAGFDQPRREAAQGRGAEGIFYRSLPYCDRMDLAYAAADLAVTRAGAGTIAELAAAALPAVLVPYPYASAHQEENAREHARGGGAALALQEGDSADGALMEAFRLLEDTERLSGMREALKAGGRHGGTEGIAALVEELTLRQVRDNKP